MHSSLEFAPSIAAVEATFLVLWAPRYWFLARQGFSGEPFDDGPWWSVAFFRLWAACHIPVLLLQAGIHALLRKQTFKVRMPFLLTAFLLHAANFGLVMLAIAMKSAGSVK